MNDKQIADQARAEHARKIKEERERECYKYVMGNKLGRQFVFDLLGACSVFRGNFDTDHSVMAFREGKRNVGLEVVARANDHTPQDYIKLLKENKPHQNNEGKTKT